MVNAFSDTWNSAYEASPADTDNISEGAGKIRNLKRDIRERMDTVDHFWDLTTTAAQGRHRKVTIKTVASNPTPLSDYNIGFTKDVDGVPETHIIDEGGNVIQLTSKGSFYQGQIDGDTLGLDYEPTNYSETVAPAQVTAYTEITAHLAGIDVALTNTIAQVAYTQTGAVNSASSYTPIAFDDTIPQNDEGAQFLQITYTPKSATNLLVIDVNAFLQDAGADGTIIGALFQDSTANALAATLEGKASDAGERGGFRLRHHMTAGTTSSTTFKFRASAISGGAMTINGDGGNRRFGGVAVSSMTITEYRQGQ